MVIFSGVFDGFVGVVFGYTSGTNPIEFLEAFLVISAGIFSEKMSKEFVDKFLEIFYEEGLKKNTDEISKQIHVGIYNGVCRSSRELKFA